MIELDVVQWKDAFGLKVKSMQITDLKRTQRTLTVILPVIKRMSYLDFIIEKGTELGVSAWMGTSTDFCADSGLVQAFLHRVPRWERIIKSAVEQSGRNDMPQFLGFRTWSEVMCFSDEFDFRVAAEFSASKQASVACAPWRGNCIFMSGPEGGWSDSELRDLGEAGFEYLWLGPTILRSETSILAGITMLLLSNITYESIKSNTSGNEC